MNVKLLAVSFVASSVLLTASASAEEVAFDMKNSSSERLIAYRNDFTSAFSSAGDGFQKYQRGVSAAIPFSIADDSLSIFVADSLGIIDETNIDEFFGITDTVNSDTGGSSGEVSASWDFDVINIDDITVTVDIGAMGDFESSDSFVWTASIDGGVEQTLFEAVVDENDSNTYILSGGNSFTLNDPLKINDITLTNVLNTFAAPVDGVGEVLTVTMTAKTDGGSEALAFQNLIVHSNYMAGGGGDPEEPPINLVKIHEIQGETNTTPLAGEMVTVEAIVVGDFQNNDAADSGDLNGFFVQEEDADVDSNSLTSEGIFVFDRPVDVDVVPGQLVRVTGTATEFSGKTQISAETVEILSSSEPLPSASVATLPVASLDDWERFESMRVVVPQTLTISEYFNFDRFGEIVLSQPLLGEERPFTPTNLEEPGSAGFSDRMTANELARITLDDGRSSGNPDPAIHPNGLEFTLDNRFRGGDHVSNVQGVLDYSFGRYRIQPTAAADYAEINQRPLIPPFVGGDIKVASFNVLNYFKSLDDGADTCGPLADSECRGADNQTEFDRQRDKIISAIAELDADIVGLIEIQNDEDQSINDLVSGLNEYLGDDVYQAVQTGFIGGDAIKVGFIYQSGRVDAVGGFAVLDSLVDARFNDDKNRPALAQTFEQVENGARVTVAVNHFKSKGSPCTDLIPPDENQNDGQGNCNLTRTQAAEALVDWLATDPTASGDEDYMIIGDINAYAKEDPIRTMEKAGYTNLLPVFQTKFAYTYVFDGQFGTLDYALANESLNEQVTGAAAWHINADEPDILDYDTSFKKSAQDALYEPNAFRSSDHDPVLVGLDLNAPPICDAASPSRSNLWPANRRFRAVAIRDVVDPDGDEVAINILGVLQDEPVTGRFDRTSPDAKVTEDGRLYLRAERQRGRKANGRVYTVMFEASSKGGYCQGEVKVAVPKYRFKGIENGRFKFDSTAVDDGAVFNSQP